MSAALFLCVAASPRSMLFGASWASLSSVRHTNTAPFPLRAPEEEELNFGSESRRPLYFCALQLLHALCFLALLEQALAVSDINSSAAGTIVVSRCGLNFGNAFLCKACPCHPSLSPYTRKNPTQGQTMKIVGIFLPEPVFTHGQLYVVLYRYRTHWIPTKGNWDLENRMCGSSTFQ
jgi:hypothetical protein